VGKMTEFIENIIYRLELKVPKGEVSRIFHGRGGTIPNFNYINIDYYPPAIFITIFKDIDYSVVVNPLIKKFGEGCPIIVQERFDKTTKSLSLGAELPQKHVVTEHGLKYLVNLEQNQNTGFFLDMKDERERIISNSSSKNILNLFSYTCSLSVAARFGGAKQIVNIDQKKSFLNIGRENHRLNNLDESIVYKSWDILRSINQIGKLGPFNLIICDPPSNQGKSFFYKKDYEKLIRKISKFLTIGGEFMACLNSPFETTDFIKDIFIKDERSWELVSERFASGEYEEVNVQDGLKICVFKLLN
jgi:23S rRNA (cytosine1962-C5)-methyltransferase